MEEEGLAPDTVEMREVRSDEQAMRERFPGSPTVRIDGEDVLAPGDGEPFGLTCRVYRLRDGRISPLPDREDVRAALRRHSLGLDRSARSRPSQGPAANRSGRAPPPSGRG